MSFFLFCSFLFKKQVFVKIVQTECKMSNLLGIFAEVFPILCKDTKKPIYIGMKMPKLFKISNLSIKIKVFAFFILYCARLALSSLLRQDKLRFGNKNESHKTFVLYCARLALSSLLRQDKLRFGNKNESFMTFVLYCARLALSLHNLCKTNYGYKLFMSLIQFFEQII